MLFKGDDNSYFLLSNMHITYDLIARTRSSLLLCIVMQKQVSAIKKVIDLSLIFTTTSVCPFDRGVPKIIILVLPKNVETLAELSALPLQLLHTLCISF